MDKYGNHSPARALLTAAALALVVNAGFAYTIAAIPTQGQRYFAAMLAAPDAGARVAANTHATRLKS